jgi:hypothetical protein
MGTTVEAKCTTIQLLIGTRDDLKSLGRKGETYDDVIQRLIKIYREHETA